MAYAVEVTSVSIADSCTKRFPTLQPNFDTALAEYRKRASLIVNEMLQREQFKSLTAAAVPQDLVDTYADSAATIRLNAGAISQQECAQVLIDFNSAADDELQGVILQILSSTKAIIEMNKVTN
jgi:hypothetical protein